MRRLLEKTGFGLSVERVLLRFASAWCLVVTCALFWVEVPFDQLLFVSSVNLIEFGAFVIAAFFLLTAISAFFDYNVDALVLGASLLVLGIVAAALRRDFYFALGILVLFIGVGYYLMRDDKLKLTSFVLSRRLMIAGIAAGGVLFVAFVGGLTSLRYLNYHTSTYDFGIFIQMFHYMKETGLPITTCERTTELSHFAVHLSPIFYLLLPGYWLFPSPVYLQVMQAVVLAVGLVPLYLLARRFEFGNKVTLAVCLVYCFYPAIAGGCFYDIHENFFLTPLLLFLFYFMEKKDWKWIYVFAVLTFMVKEDAPLYVACIALYLLVSRKEYFHGTALLAVSILYFVGAGMFLQSFGEGANALNGRLGNYMSDPQHGLMGIFKTIFVDPQYVINEVFKPDKVIYILAMLLPLAFLPVISRKLSQLVLIIPFLVINLMSNYPYMINLSFQYHFGSAALLIYLFVVNLSGMKRPTQRFVAPFAVAASIVLFVTVLYGYTDNIKTYIDGAETREQLNQILDAIPEDASVQASGFLLPRLSQRRVIYDVGYNNAPGRTPLETEYVVLDMRGSGAVAEAKTHMERYESRGYTRVVEQDGLVLILRAPQ